VVLVVIEQHLLEVLVEQLTVVDGILEGGGNMLLAHHFLEAEGAVFAGRNNEIIHQAER
jgi:hypothetical protein